MHYVLMPLRARSLLAAEQKTTCIEWIRFYN